MTSERRKAIEGAQKVQRAAKKLARLLRAMKQDDERAPTLDVVTEVGSLLQDMAKGWMAIEAWGMAYLGTTERH